MTFRQQINPNKTVFSQSHDLNFSTHWSRVSSQNLQSPNSHDGWQTVWCQTGQHHKPPAMITHKWHGGVGVMVWGGITMTRRVEGQNSTSARGMSLGSTTETMSLS